MTLAKLVLMLNMLFPGAQYIIHTITEPYTVELWQGETHSTFQIDDKQILEIEGELIKGCAEDEKAHT